MQIEPNQSRMCAWRMLYKHHNIAYDKVEITKNLKTHTIFQRSEEYEE